MTNPIVSANRNPNYKFGMRSKNGAYSWAPAVEYPAPGQPVTPEHFKKLLLDSKFFRERFFHIIDMEGHRVPYLQNAAQEKYYFNKTTHDLILKPRKLGFCLSADTPVLTRDLIWKKISDVQIGDELISVDENIPGGRGATRKMRTSRVKEKFVKRDVCYRLKFDTGHEIVATAKHRFLSLKYRSGCETAWKPVSWMRVGDVVRFVTRVWGSPGPEDHWFSGILDGEGSLSFAQSGAGINASQTFGPVWNRMVSYANATGLFVRQEIDERTTYRCGDDIRPCKPKGKVCFTRMNEIFEIIGKCRPTRFIGVRWWEGKDLPGKRSGDAWAKIVSIEEVGEIDVVDISTTTGTFIAAGLVSHNSSEIEGDFLFECMTRENITAVTMAQSEDEAKVHLSRIKFYMDTCGAAGFKFNVKTGKMNETEIFFTGTNSYYWIGTAGSTSWGRGRTINRFHGSEIAHWSDQRVLTAVLEAVPSGPNTRRVLETTANGIGEKFHEMWWEACDDGAPSPWTPHFWAWWNNPANTVPDCDMPDRMEFTEYEQMLVNRFGVTANQIQWLRTKTAAMADKSLRPQEHPSFADEAFLSSGRPVLNIERVDQMRSRVKEPMWIGGLKDDGYKVEPYFTPDGLLTAWIPPRPTNTYLVAADIALGVRGGAFSVGVVFDRATWEVVAEWRGRLEPAKFGDELVKLGLYYNNALLAPELNNMGRVTIQRIKDRRYPHLVVNTDFFPDMNEEEGMPTTEKTKSQYFSELRNAVDDFSYQENSRIALTEMRSAVYDASGKIVSNMDRNLSEEEKGAHLDCVMARAIGIFVLAHLTKTETYRMLEEGGPVVTNLTDGRGHGRRY